MGRLLVTGGTRCDSRENPGKIECETTLFFLCSKKGGLGGS